MLDLFPALLGSDLSTKPELSNALSEPTPTAWLLFGFGGLVVLSALLSRTSRRLGVPVILLFLALGMLAGSEGLGGIYFDDHLLAFRIGTLALVLILFDGGLNTTIDSVRKAIGPAAVLATLGVAGTAAIVALAAWLMGVPWQVAAVLGAVVSSTDAAAVFSVLRGSGIQLQPRLGSTLEVESGANDPMAVILTVAFTQSLASGAPLGAELAIDVVVQLVVGCAGGVAVGYIGRWLLRHAKLPAGGLYPALTVALAALAFALPTLLLGSGFLAVYVAGIVLGNGPIPYRGGLLRVHDGMAWLAQISMFLLLGLLVFPSQLVGVATTGLAIAAVLILIARPLSVLVCLLPFRFPVREIGYISWVGLRGAVPIVLATIPVLAGIEGGQRIFNLVFFVVVVAAIVQGGSVRWLTRRLGLQAEHPPPPLTTVELTSEEVHDDEVATWFIRAESRAAGKSLSELSFPDGVSVMLVVRGARLISPRGTTRLEPGDHVHVICRPDTLEQVAECFAAGPQD